jgi:hypothetical protein
VSKDHLRQVLLALQVAQELSMRLLKITFAMGLLILRFSEERRAFFNSLSVIPIPILMFVGGQ